MAIYFYVVRDEWGWMSNFSPHGVDLDGTWWPTVEHYFQAAKFVSTDPAHAATIARVSRPHDAARLGRDRGHPLRPDWEAVKEDVMRRAVRCKLSTHPELRALILATGDEEIVETSPSDYFWGAGLDGSGQNRLGHILMEVRAALRVEPPATAPPPKDRRKKGA